ncbi:ABC transporter permease [Streptomyces sp. 15-116A]|uniref:ABC transporter permease n=1 Tax=Streptomyces sp. 15-116A TaxID=2259035 RepID=UPI0021B36647|nr:ABC transporter permease [Streptomyces sp. 15-116A]MCT7354310.1 ABC transporter permease [Streptomyces sp. 15-116A]
MTPAPASGRPAPRQLRWLLRLHRPAALAWAAFTLVTGAALLWLGGPLTDAAATAWKEYNACAFAPRCSYDQDAILRYKDTYTYTTTAVLAAPFLVAAWAGASLTGRELESGTARLAWTQAVSPTRWLAARLAFPALLITVSTGLLVWLHRRAWTAGNGRIDTAKPWYDMPTFYANGVLPVALALAGLAVGVLTGLLLRRTLAALATAAVALAGLWTAVHLVLPHLWTTVTERGSLGEGPPGAGIEAGEGILTADGTRLPAPCGSSHLPGCRAELADLNAVAFYRDVHPASHFWPLHLVAPAAVLLLTALLAYAAFRLVRRHTAGPATRPTPTAAPATARAPERAAA